MDCDLVLLNIFDFIYPSELVHLRLVCKKWHHFIIIILKKKFRNRWKGKIELYFTKIIKPNIQCCCIRNHKIYYKIEKEIYSFNILNGKEKLKTTFSFDREAYYIQYNSHKFTLGNYCSKTISDNINLINRIWHLKYSYYEYPCRNSKGEIYYLNRSGWIIREKRYFILSLYTDRSYIVNYQQHNSLYIDKNDVMYATNNDNKIIIFDSNFTYKNIIRLKAYSNISKIIIRAVIDDYLFVTNKGSSYLYIYDMEGNYINKIVATRNTFVYKEMLYTFDTDGKLLVY